MLENTKMVKNKISSTTLIVKDVLEETKTSNEMSVKEEMATISIEDEVNHSLESLPECDLLKYPNKLLRIVGLFHRKDDKLILKAYTISLCLIDLINLIRLMLSYEIIYGRSEPALAVLILKVICTIWFFVCFCSSLIIFINNECPRREQAFLNSAYHMIELSPGYCRQKKLRFTVYLIYSIVGSLTLFAALFFSVALLGPKVLFNGVSLFLSPFHTSDWAIDSTPFKILILLLCIVSTAHCLLSNAVFLAHTVIPIELICKFNSDFMGLARQNVLVTNESTLRKTIATNRIKSVMIDTKAKTCFSEDRFDEFRIRYLKIAFVVERLDECFKELIAIIVVAYTIALLLLLYIVSDWSGNCVTGILNVLYPYWIILTANMLFLIIIFPAVIHSLVPIYNYFTLILTENLCISYN